MPTTRNQVKRKPAPEDDDEAVVEIGSGNVFADLGLPQPNRLLAKAVLVRNIRQRIAERNLSQRKAGELLGLDQPKISELLRGKTAGYSMDRLFKFLNLLGQSVEIIVRPVASTDEVAETRVIG